MENPGGDTEEAKDDVKNKENQDTCKDVINSGANENPNELKKPDAPLGTTETLVELKTPEAPLGIAETPVELKVPNPRQSTVEIIDFTVIHNKIKHDVQFPLDDTVLQLKKHLENVIGIPHSMQKVMFKGITKDEKTLRELGIVKGSKVMVVGSKLNDVLAVSTPSTQDLADDKSSSSGSTKEPFCRQKMHRKVLDKGIPDDVMPGIKGVKEPLPPFPLVGMLNKSGGKVRLTFKLELDQVWLGTKERTEKLSMNSIKSIVSEPIEGFEQYHVMGLQLGTTEASRYWVYWVPAQFVDSIKDAILGTWLL